MEQYRLGESEYRFACIVWANEPLASGKLVELCAAQLGWKKSTTYTVLKNLCNKGVLQNQSAVVTSLVKQQQVQKYESAQVVDKTFGGSLPQFIAAFLGQKGLSPEDAAQIQAMIDQYTKGGKGAM